MKFEVGKKYVSEYSPLTQFNCIYVDDNIGLLYKNGQYLTPRHVVLGSWITEAPLPKFEVGKTYQRKEGAFGGVHWLIVYRWDKAYAPTKALAVSTTSGAHKALWDAELPYYEEVA